MCAKSFLASVLIVLAALPQLHSQSQSGTAGETDRSVIHSTTREVVLDVIVRDKHHHALTDLRPEEVEVYEDGVRQNVKEFRDVQGAEQLKSERAAGTPSSPTDAGPAHPASASGEQPHALNSMRQVNFVSVVFAGIAPLNLEFARRAVLEFLKSDNLPNTYVTIYKLDRNLSVVQPFTSDKDTLAKGVDLAAKGLSGKGVVNTNAQATSAVVATVQANAANILAAPSTGAVGQATAQAAQNEVDNPLPAIARDPLWAANAASQDASVTLGNALLVQASMEKGLRFVNSQSDGMNALDTLHALIRSAEKLPGRKVVLYLADGLTFPADRHDAVDSLISHANRSGVAFYTIDTRGLNVDDPVMSALVQQRRTQAESSAQLNDPQNGHFEDDDVALTAVASGQLNMRELAESTGGFAVTNTNEISLPMQHMMEDIRTHYEVAYSPTSTTYDGHFRKIEVRISRPKVTVQTRKGYFAVPDLNGEPLQPFELVALNAMNTTPAPVEFPYQFAAMKFRPGQDGVEYEVTFEVPVSGLKAVANAKTAKSRVQASLVALIHDSNGAVIGKVSRELARESATAELAQAGNILYAEPVELRPGHYVIDAAVTDELTGKTSVKRTSVFVAPENSLAVSSLGLVRRFDPLSEPHEAVSPFELANGRVTPTLVDSVASGNPVSLYFVVYPENVSADGLKVTLDLLQDGKTIARKPLNLGKPGPDGSIPMVVQLSPGPGQCDVLVTAQQGTAVAKSNFSLRVQ